MDYLKIRGARQHNLKNVNLDIPKYQLVVLTGVSGSGKSSLAFDTIYAEGQRRYVESLSSYARQFLGIMDKPDVDSIVGLSPAISIDQKSTSHNPRSTVGTVTEIYDYLRLLYARIGHPHCSKCGREISKLSKDQIVSMMVKDISEQLATASQKICMFLICSPVVRDRKGEFLGLLQNLLAKGYKTVRIDGHVLSTDEDYALIKTNKHSIDAVINRFAVDQKMMRDEISLSQLKKRLYEAVEQALTLSQGLVTMSMIEDRAFTIPERPKHMRDIVYSEHFSCPVCGISMPEIEPRTFSFNSPHGACPTCSGIGRITTVNPKLILNPELSISEGGIMPFTKMFFHDTWFSRILTTVSDIAGIDPKKELKYLSDEQKHILLYGTGDTVHEVTGTNRFGSPTVIYETFQGIIGELKRRHKESQSEYVKTEIERYMRDEICPDCQGLRLKKESLTITIDTKNISEITKYSIADCKLFIHSLLTNEKNPLLSKNETTIAKPIVKEILGRLTFLTDVGLDYLTLDRGAGSLSGGEAQRIRLASQIGSGLSGVLYVLDEPSIGLHQRDNNKLIDTLIHLKTLGNTVIVVEHDRDMMMAADYLVDFGPGAGDHGGDVIAQGSPKELIQNPKSITAKYLSNKKIIERPKIIKSQDNPHALTLIGAKEHNLKNIDVSFPLGKFICVTGVSGSGKSTLIVDTLWSALEQKLQPLSKVEPGAYKEIEGLEFIDKTILIDQSPIGRTPRSNPATYTGIFTHIRDLFSQLPESKERGYTSGRFSFNMKGGRCDACDGEGQKRIEMQFLSDVFVTCDVCSGTRYNHETLEVQYHGKTITDILNLPVEEAIGIFAHHPIIKEKLITLSDVGLSYMKLGQPAPTLSGGEAQRVKLATELIKRSTGKTVYILDEPTTGLHFADLEKLLTILHRLTAQGNTVIVIEHNLDIIKNADWIIDMGPEGGNGGGYIVTSGSPETIAKHPSSYTGQYLKTQT